MKISFTNIIIFLLFLSVLGLGYYVATKPSEVFQDKSPNEAYLNWVSHTEYIAGDSAGQAIISVSDYKGRPLTADCKISLVYPNHTFVFTDYIMIASIIDGNYYRTFTVPNTFGVYTEFVNCTIQLGLVNISASKSNSIHVNPAFDFLVNISQNITAIHEQINNLSIDMKNNFTNIENILNNMSVDINNNFTYTNNLIAYNFNNTNWLIINTSANVTNTITNFRNEAYTWYVDLANRVYQCCQKWVEEFNNVFKNFGQVIQVVPNGGGVTQSQQSWWKRIIGGD